MFNESITVYHYDKKTDMYNKTVLNGWHWQSKITAQKDGKGTFNSIETTIISNAENAQNFSVAYEICINDRIVKGVNSDIKSFKELKDSICVNGIEVNVYGSSLDNIVVTGI